MWVWGNEWSKSIMFDFSMIKISLSHCYSNKCLHMWADWVFRGGAAVRLWQDLHRRMDLFTSENNWGNSKKSRLRGALLAGTRWARLGPIEHVVNPRGRPNDHAAAALGRTWRMTSLLLVNWTMHYHCGHTRHLPHLTNGYDRHMMLWVILMPLTPKEIKRRTPAHLLEKVYIYTYIGQTIWLHRPAKRNQQWP